MKLANKKSKKEYIYYLLLLISAAGIVLHSSVVNPLSGDNSNDSWVFRYMGMLIAKGGVPYRDAFDQKGPLLYFFEFIGYVINRDFGIWLLEAFSMFVCLVFTYKLCRRHISCMLSLICTVISVSSLSVFFSGNMCEEFALPFLAISIYIFADYFIMDKYTNVRIICCGICFGCVLLLRPNMTALWVVMCVSVILKSIMSDKKFPGKLTILFLAGTLVSVLPILTWLFFKNGLVDFINQYLLHNARYTSGPYSFIDHMHLALKFAGSSMLIIPLAILIYLSVKLSENRFFNITFLVFVIFNALMCSISVRGYLHYGMPLVVSHAYPLAAISAYFSEKKKSGESSFKFLIQYLIYTVYSVMLIIFIINNIITFAESIMNYKTSVYDLKLVEEIREYTDSDDKILVLGYGSAIYYQSDRLCSAQFYIQEPIYDNNPLILEDMQESLNSNLPKVVINNFTEDDGVYNTFFNHMDEYELVDKYTRFYVRK